MSTPEKSHSVPWSLAALEIEDEARVRGDLDQRTVNALVKRLHTLSKGYDMSHLERRKRAAQNDHEVPS